MACQERDTDDPPEVAQPLEVHTMGFHNHKPRPVEGPPTPVV